MAKSAFPAIFLLLLLHQIANAAANASSDGGGVEAACKRVPDVKFCVSLLEPYASQFSSSEADDGGVKKGMAAMNATLERVDELRQFTVHEAVQEQTTPEQFAAMTGCLSNIGNGEGALKVALVTLNETQGTERAELVKMIGSATEELTACVDSLKKYSDNDVVRKALTLTEASVQACSVAQAFLP